MCRYIARRSGKNRSGGGFAQVNQADFSPRRAGRSGRKEGMANSGGFAARRMECGGGNKRRYLGDITGKRQRQREGGAATGGSMLQGARAAPRVHFHILPSAWKIALVGRRGNAAKR